MCGIGGKLWYRDGADAELLYRMAQSMVHRGPDAEGVWLNAAQGIGLCSRRLSIIDLDRRADQPLQNADGTSRVVFNGEIYNYQQLRASLEGIPGHVFRTASDTEVLLHLYEEYGLEGLGTYLNRLRGMFAFALWDGRRRVLLLARDPIGKKPLFYAETNEGIVFASTIRALLKDPGVRRSPNSLALQLYLTLGYVPAPLTAFEGIHKLRAGEYIVADRRGVRAIGQYWAPEFEPKLTMHRSELERTLLEKLEGATRLRMISDVPVGAFLSGGLDSTAVVAMMTRLSSRPVKTFSVTFAGRREDESAYARLVARHFGCEHTELSVAIQPDSLPNLVEEFEEPFADPAAIPTYFMSKAASRHVKVILNGDGGDEDFAGYTLRHRAYSYAEALRCPAVFHKGILLLSGLIPTTRSESSLSYRSRKALRILGEIGWRRNVALMEVLPPRDLEGWARNWNGSGDARFRPLLSLWQSAQKFAGLDRELYFSFSLHLPEQLLVKVDRASMAWSLEVRSPLLDREFVELCARIPVKYKLQGPAGKFIFRRALRDILPREILTRRKQSFNPPLDEWLRHDLRALLEESLLSEDTFVSRLLDPAFVHRLVREHLDGRRDHQRRVYTLLSLELWERKFIRGRFV